MEYLFVEYPKCSTCQKAKKFLEDNNIIFTDRHIKEDNPKADELKIWIKKSSKDINKFFNTSGLVYRSLGLKDKLKTMSDDEKINLLSTDGMLVKRPILIGDKGVLVGFKQSEWEEFLK